MKYLVVKNFEKFQHYRDRNPPWIKLYGDLLTDLAFLQLPEAAQAQLVKLWILASQLGHPLPNNPKLLAGKIATTGRFHLASIIDAGFLIPCNDVASAPLAECSENATPSVRARNQRSELEVVDDDPRIPAEPELTALFIAICANGAITERWGEQLHPVTQANGIDLATSLAALRVEPQVARLSIYRQCRESRQAKPPRGPNYFKPGIIADWEGELARRALAASGEVPPPVESPTVPPSGAGASSTNTTGARREHWTDKKAREDREEANRQLIRIRAGNVEQRCGRIDGDAWWVRIQREAKAAGINPILYGYDRMHEPAHPAEVVHV